jgi:hypothetical protein
MGPVNMLYAKLCCMLYAALKYVLGCALLSLWLHGLCLRPWVSALRFDDFKLLSCVLVCDFLMGSGAVVHAVVLRCVLLFSFLLALRRLARPLCYCVGLLAVRMVPSFSSLPAALREAVLCCSAHGSSSTASGLLSALKA